MSYGYDTWGTYVSVEEKRRRARQAVAKLRKSGQTVSPVTIEGRQIATTFWGQAWCDNMERYRDYESRLPRGRNYVRQGSVVDLQIAPGRITAMVSGSELYDVIVTIKETAEDAVAGDLHGLRGRHRFAGRAVAGAVFQGRHGAALPPAGRPVSAPGRYPVFLQLHGSCLDVQACRGGAVWRRRTLR